MAYAAKYFGRAATYRWDDPRKVFGVLYMADDEAIAFLETLMHSTRQRDISFASIAARGLARIVASSQLRLVDLRGAGLPQLGADNRLSTGPYSMAQRWSRALHDHPAQPDGIYYRSRRDPSGYSVALFDRAEAQVTAIPECGLADASYTRRLAEILDRYEFGIY